MHLTRLSLFMLFLISMVGCTTNETNVLTEYFFDVNSRLAGNVDLIPLNKGKTYLSTYSQVYQKSSLNKFDLTVTLSIRSTDLTGKTYLLSAKYYDTEGRVLKDYIKEPIFLNPVETVEIVIREDDKSGGTGGNFIFEWAVEGNNEPLFEAVMISTKSSQGISFVTQGVRIE